MACWMATGKRLTSRPSRKGAEAAPPRQPLQVQFFYSLILYLATPFVCGAMLWRGLRDRSYWDHFSERFGFGEPAGVGGIWVHAVSVGEVQASVALVKTLRERYPTVPLTVTTLTPTGASRARALFRDTAYVRYIPFDLPGAVRRFFERVQPRFGVVFETELWPNLYRECSRRRVPLVLASARVSPRSVNRYRLLGALFRDVLSGGVVIAAQGEGDAQRFQSLGADPDRTHVTGNLKFDFTLPVDISERGQRLRQQYAPGRPVWVAGSTHDGEEEKVVAAHRLVQKQHPGSLLVLAPRHPPRFEAVASELQKAGVRFVRRSTALPSQAASNAEVLLVDTLGELLDFYEAGDVAFVGGSLVRVGGHNLLEPAALGRPILTGPDNSNSEEIARLLIARGAAQVVQDSNELGQRVAALLADAHERARIGELGRDSIDDHRGALGKLLRLIEPLLG